MAFEVREWRLAACHGERSTAGRQVPGLFGLRPGARRNPRVRDLVLRGADGEPGSQGLGLGAVTSAWRCLLERPARANHGNALQSRPLRPTLLASRRAPMVNAFASLGLLLTLAAPAAVPSSRAAPS